MGKVIATRIDDIELTPDALRLLADIIARDDNIQITVDGMREVADTLDGIDDGGRPRSDHTVRSFWQEMNIPGLPELRLVNRDYPLRAF